MGALRIVVLASGTGSNLQAILDELHGRDAMEVVGVASNRAAATALTRAQEAGVETAVFSRESYEDREARDEALGDWIEGRDPGLVVLAGYMELLTPGLVGRLRNRVINVHPALLPSFPGLDAVGQALAAGVRVTGVTVHFVDEGVDSGAIIMQRAIPIPPERDRPRLEGAIHAAEHELLPAAIRLFAEGRVRLDPEDPRLVHIDSAPDGER